MHDRHQNLSSCFVKFKEVILSDIKTTESLFYSISLALQKITSAKRSSDEKYFLLLQKHEAYKTNSNSKTNQYIRAIEYAFMRAY